MKATGIVRKIEEYGIIGQNSTKPHKHYGLAVFNETEFAQKYKIHIKSKAKFTLLFADITLFNVF